MHRNAGRYLSENTKAHLLRDGLTHAVHDMAVEDLNTRRWERTHLSELPNVHMNYPALVLDYECEITCGNNRYEFHVIQDTKKLLEVGRTLHNCVAGYYREVIDKYSIIVAVRHDNIWVVCIEIREQRTIAQALGLHNRLLEGELLAVCQYWMKVKNLVLNTNHLNFRAPEDKERAETFWEYMDLHELPTA